MNRILFFLLIALHLQAQSNREKKGFVEVESENYIYQTKTDIRKWKIIDKNNPDDAVHSAGKNKYINCLPDTRITHDDTLINGINFSNQPGLN